MINKKIIWCLSFLLLTTSCSILDKKTQKQTKQTHKTKYKRVIDNNETGVDRSSSTTNESEFDAARTLVLQGLKDYKKKDYEAAEWIFEEAINVDANYGPAYYWLARIRYRLGSPEKIDSLLKRAKELLSGSARWKAKIKDFEAYLKRKATEEITE